MLNVFTNESIIEEHMRAAAVTLRLREEKMCYISTEKMTTVFRAELQRIIMTTDITRIIKETQKQDL